MRKIHQTGLKLLVVFLVVGLYIGFNGSHVNAENIVEENKLETIAMTNLGKGSIIAILVGEGCAGTYEIFKAVCELSTIAAGTTGHLYVEEYGVIGLFIKNFELRDKNIFALCRTNSENEEKIFFTVTSNLPDESIICEREE